SLLRRQVRTGLRPDPPGLRRAAHGHPPGAWAVVELPGMLVIALHESGYLPRWRVPAEPVAGGMVNEAARVETERGPVFVKWKMDAPPDTFACEADGLRRLAAADTLRLPVVLGFADASASD